MAQVGSKYQDWGRLKSVGSAISDITKTSSTFAHVEENRIFYLFQKKILYFPFQNLLLWIFFCGEFQHFWKWYHSCWNCQGTVVWAIWAFMFIYASELFYCMKFCTITKFKKDCSKPNFSKREKSKIYIYKIYKIWKFLSIVQASSKKYVRMFTNFLCIFVMSQI